MSNPNKARGDRWERSVLDFLREVFGRAAIRPRQEGHIDVGDVHLSPWALQLKDEASHNFSGYLNDAEKQAAAAGEPFAAAVVKRRRYSVDRGYVVMTLATFRRATARLRRAEELLLRANSDLFDKHMSENLKENENR
ncbi:hypothetical protein JOF56_003708 [Kibdelosporangium banguiense]|uniref:Holliday junction resolvase n=1 Tax=Kibdelosporangium banguiense TaxID=1365924 RepID=A0ABS4TFW9_9PSEU|nr:hypothetical protein [Kibdelosporangium banguiense]MBP2323323.1 hypothetical protein [Kibdelosporangium banguiense]